MASEWNAICITRGIPSCYACTASEKRMCRRANISVMMHPILYLRLANSLTALNYNCFQRNTIVRRLYECKARSFAIYRAAYLSTVCHRHPILN